jgi:hypothetical protein
MNDLNGGDHLKSYLGDKQPQNNLNKHSEYRPSSKCMGQDAFATFAMGFV